MRKNDIALYVAGDSNIIYPALVFLCSVKKFNKEIDLYIFSEKEKICKEYLNFAEMQNISILDLEELDRLDRGYINNFEKMGRWPKHVFFNWLAPSYFDLNNYSYAIKADYDMICVDKFNMKDIIPNAKEVISVLPKGALVNRLDAKAFTEIQKELSFNIPKGARSANVGFVVFDLKRWNECDLQRDYIRSYLYLQEELQKRSSALQTETVEQAAFGCLQGKTGGKFKELPASYNYRPLFENSGINPIVFHYNTGIKPWGEVDEKLAIHIQSKGLSVVSQLIYFVLWSEFARSLPIARPDAIRTYTPIEINEIIKQIFNGVLERHDIDHRELIIREIKESIDKHLPVSLNWKINPKFRWIQVPISEDGGLHYEILIENKTVRCVLHFEGKWKSESLLAKNINLLEIDGVQQICNVDRGEVGYILNSPLLMQVTRIFISLYYQVQPQLRKILAE